MAHSIRTANLKPVDQIHHAVEATDENTAFEILRAGNLCPNCGFSWLVKEGMQVFCPICNYGAVKCT